MDREKLNLWQDRLKKNETAYAGELYKMKSREAIYAGSDRISRLVPGDEQGHTNHVRNVAAELIETQVNSNIPQPKVTPKRPEDAWRAKLIEDVLRNELDRLPFETMNDLAERTVPIQGGVLFLVEWDMGKSSRSSAGELLVSLLHPRQVIPQEGVYTGIEDMDYIILKTPQTKEAVYRKYGVRLPEGDEEDWGDQVAAVYTAYYRGENGRIGLYSWAEDTELEDDSHVQARHIRLCKGCGMPNADRQRKSCEHCHGRRFEERVEEHEQLIIELEGMPVVVTVPSYRPDVFPVLLQKNVSVYEKFLGDSDIDKIEDQQNTINRIEQKIIDKLLKSGSYLVLPEQADIEVNAEDMKLIRPETPAAANQIGVKDLQGNIAQDMEYLEQVYQEARQITGVTESFQGRKDNTATSGKAKEFSAAQTAGRLESKRVMKNAAYAQLFELMFKYLLAYMDEPRPIASKDERGNPEFKTFCRSDFLDRDAAGEWYWNDSFNFSCDTTALLASNREAMWEETRMNLESGAFGNPQLTETLIIFWKKMEMLQYPGAAETKAALEKSLEREYMPEMQQ